MVNILKHLRKGKYLATISVAALTLAVGVATLAPAASAAAYTCRVVNAERGGYEAGAIYTKKYWVPGSSVSSCVDINVRNIQAKDAQGNNIVGDNCAKFKVQFFPTWGSPYYGTAKTICSKGPNGPVVPLATSVYNGTEYRIWYDVEQLGRTHAFQIVD